MSVFNHEKEDYIPNEQVPSKSPIKGIALVAGILIGVSHIGLLGYVLNKENPESVQQPPTFNLPRGPYSSYTELKLAKMDMKLNIVQMTLRF